MAELEIKNLNKYYQLGNKTKFHALTDINLTFEKGELVSIVGESGSGKSTFMNLIGGLDSDFEGEINVNGENIKKLTDKELDEYRKKKIGFVFQSFNLIPHLTILDNVTIALTLSNVKESEKVQKATEILERLGLKAQMKKKPSQLSGGQKQRVAIARALINDPEIILADEPTGALDSDTTLQILDILKEIADDGKLVIMVTHSEKVASISSRVVEVADGKIISDKYKSDYKKTKKHKANKLVAKQEEEQISKKKKTNLSYFSAIKLAFHNMWASKVKNFLIAFGVAISLVSLILMLSFGSGLTDYISGLADSYTNPLYVSISKSKDENGNQSNPLNPLGFDKQEEIDSLIADINKQLEENGYEFRATEENVSYGFNKMTYGSASFTFKTNEEGKYDENGESTANKGVFYIYTTPPYYDETKMIVGNISGQNEVMFSKAVTKILGYENDEDVIGAKIQINIPIFGINTELAVDSELNLTGNPTISGIVDVSNMFENFPVIYVSYNYLQSLIRFTETTTGKNLGFYPYSIYIKTDAEETTNFITNYLNSLDNYSGSVEQQMVSMFTEMISTISTALAIIAGISIVVATIMILVVLYMSVTERTREIGVLKSIGARRKDIKRIFSSESLLIGLLSGIVGIVLALVFGGVLIIALKAILGFAPISFRWWYFLVALGISIVISILAGLMPAAKAAKLDPVESLRHE